MNMNTQRHYIVAFALNIYLPETEEKEVYLDPFLPLLLKGLEMSPRITRLSFSANLFISFFWFFCIKLGEHKYSKTLHIFYKKFLAARNWGKICQTWPNNFLFAFYSKSFSTKIDEKAVYIGFSQKFEIGAK